jgi:cytochrome c oxidase cbb3-type subunit IV
MFKFIKKYAETMEDISIYPLISLVIFFVFFMGVLWYVKQMKKTEVSDLEKLPLEP